MNMGSPVVADEIIYQTKDEGVPFAPEASVGVVQQIQQYPVHPVKVFKVDPVATVTGREFDVHANQGVEEPEPRRFDNIRDAMVWNGAFELALI